MARTSLYAADTRQQSENQLPSINAYQQLLTMKSIVNASKIELNSAYNNLIQYVMLTYPQFKACIEQIKKDSHKYRNKKNNVERLVLLINELSHQDPYIIQLNTAYKKASVFHKQQFEEYTKYAMAMENPSKEKAFNSVVLIPNDSIPLDELFKL